MTWHIKAKLTDNTVVDEEDDIYYINRVAYKVEHLGLFYNGQYRGTIVLSSPWRLYAEVTAKQSGEIIERVKCIELKDLTFMLGNNGSFLVKSKCPQP